MYCGGNVETDHHFICSMPENVVNPLAFHKFTDPVSGTLREIIENDNTRRDKTPSYYYG